MDGVVLVAVGWFILAPPIIYNHFNASEQQTNNRVHIALQFYLII
jgi:hypothetical protein